MNGKLNIRLFIRCWTHG